MSRPRMMTLRRSWKSPRNLNLLSPGGTLPDDVIEVHDEPEKETKASEPITVHACRIKEKGGTSSKPATMPMPKPLSHHTPAAPKGQLEDAIKGKLEAAKECLEDAVWLYTHPT